MMCEVDEGIGIIHAGRKHVVQTRNLFKLTIAITFTILNRILRGIRTEYHLSSVFQSLHRSMTSKNADVV